MKLVISLLVLLIAGCTNPWSLGTQFTPPAFPSPTPPSGWSRPASYPHIRVVNRWTSDTQFIEWSEGCTFPLTPNAFTLSPGQAQVMTDSDEPCMANGDVKTFVDADPLDRERGCVLKIRYGPQGSWRFRMVPLLRGGASHCKLWASRDEATLIFDAAP